VQDDGTGDRVVRSSNVVDAEWSGCGNAVTELDQLMDLTNMLELRNWNKSYTGLKCGQLAA
jgi:hypothetical protein